MYEQVEQYRKPGTLITSNTSGIPIHLLSQGRSEDFKQQKVREIERKETTISEVSKAYQVRYNNVQKWVEKYSSTYKKGLRLVVEMESETKKLLVLQQKIAALERVVGQKQIVIDFQSKMIDLAEATYGVDIKKNSISNHCLFLAKQRKDE